MPNRRYNDQVSARPLEEKVSSGGAMTDGKPWAEAVPGDLLALDAKTRGAIESLCRKGIESWIRNSGTHHENLVRWNDLLEGVMEQTSFPWEGASNLHIPLIAIHVVTLHSVMARSITTVDPLWHFRTLDPAARERAADQEEAINYKAKSELNVIQAVRDVLYTTPRDGLGWLWGWWAEETTPVEEVIPFGTVEEFQNEFPTPEAAGLDDTAYADVLKEISAAGPDAPYGVRIERDRVDYLGPKFEVVDEAVFVRAPMTAQTLKECRVYGRMFRARTETMKEEAEDGKLWVSAVKAWTINAKTKATDDNKWSRALDAIEGISEDDQGDFSDERRLFRLVVRYKMQGEKKERLFLCCYSHDTKRCLGISKYPYARDCAIPFRIIRRPGRMSGKSVPEQLEDMNASLDASINYEENSDTLEMAPIFKGKKTLKNKDSDFDPALEENWIRPGATLWMDSPGDFVSMQINGGAKADAKSRRQEIIRYAEMLIGPTQLLSGQESRVDPNAPGNKTIALIQQSNMRIEDYIKEFGLGFDDLGEFIRSLYRQFGSSTLDYMDSEGNVSSVESSLFGSKGRMAMHGVTVNLSPEVEYAKAANWWVLLKDEPMVGGDPGRRRQLLSDLLVSGRNPSRDALMPPRPEVEQAQMADMEKKAEARVMTKLIKAGAIPPPPPPAGPMMPPGAGPLPPAAPPAMPPMVPAGA
jgi:hypothetical protein